MKQRSQIILIFFATLIFTSCSKEKEAIKLPVQIVYPVKSINQYNDSTFVTRVRDVININNEFWMTDFENARIMVVDTGLNLQHIVGKKGRGPDENICFEKIFTRDNRVFAYDPCKKVINRYTSNYESIPHFKLNADTRIYHLTNFVVDKQDNVWGCRSGKNRTASIIGFDIKNKIINKFTPPFPIMENFNTFNKEALYHIAITNNNTFYLIGNNYPIIYQYSYNGDLLNSYDLSYLDLFKEVCNVTSKSIKNDPRGFHMFTQNVKTYKSRIYILCYTADKNENKYCDKILVVETSNNEIKPVKVINLKPGKNIKGWYPSFCLFDDESKILAMNSKSDEIQIFNINP